MKLKLSIKVDTPLQETFQMNQEPITRSLHLPYIFESTFARIFLFLDQFLPQVSLNSQERILCIVVCCVVLFWVMLCCIILYCVAYSTREPKSPAVCKKNRKIRPKLVPCCLYGRWRLRVMRSYLRGFCLFSFQILHLAFTAFMWKSWE